VEAKLQRWVQQRGWDRAASHYESTWCDQLRPAHDAALELADLRPGEQVLDIACGTGRIAIAAAQAVGPLGAVLATDLSQRMVDDTAKRAADLGLGNVETRRCGAESLDVTDQFDVALCALGLMYVPAPAVAVAEALRALRPGGRAVFAVWGERRKCGWADIFPIVDSRVASDVCPMFFALGAPGALTGLVASAGFDDVEERRITTDLCYDDASGALGAAFLGGPVALAYSRFDDGTRESAHAEYLASIEPFRSGAAYRIPGEFVVVSGRRPPTPTTNPLTRSIP
jgi:ubiquinone/menaquinone biosynthesis C-methylase UbiE